MTDDFFAARLNRRLGSKIRPREISTHYSFYQQVLPQGTIPQAGGVLTFQVPAQSGKFVDLKSSFLEVNASITGASTIDSNYYVPQESLKMGFGDLLWSTVQTQIGSSVLTDTTQTFNFIPSFIRKSLSKPSGWAGPNTISYESKSLSQGSTGTNTGSYTSQVGLPGGCGDGMGYNLCNSMPEVASSGETSLDVENEFNPIFSPATLSRSLKCWNKVFYQTASVTPTPPLATPKARAFSFLSWPSNAFSEMDMLLPDNVPINLFFTRSRDNLIISSINASCAASLTINSVRLWVRFVQPSEAAMQEFRDAIIERPISLPYLRANASLVNISTGSTSINASGLCAGLRPDIVCISFHLASAISGSYSYSPFAMRPGAFSIQSGTIPVPQISQLYITWGGMNYPLLPYNPDSDSSTPNGIMLDQNDARAYFNYLALSNHGISDDSSPLLSYTQFTQQYGFYCIDLRPSASYETGEIGTVRHTDESDQGALQIVGNFAQAPGLDIVCCVTALGGGQLIIDAGRNVLRSGF